MNIGWTEFWSRLQSVSDEVGIRSQVDLASALGVRSATITDAKHRDSVPPKWCMILMETKGLSPQWLATGSGQAFIVDSMDNYDSLSGYIPKDHSTPTESLDTHLLTEIIDGLETALDQQDLELAPDKKAQLITLLYEHFQATKGVDTDTVERYLRLVV